MEINTKEFGTYSKNDVVFLLKDISDAVIEKSNEERAKAIEHGVHYSEMLPIEYEVTDEYMKLYREKLQLYKEKLAYYVGVMSEKILKQRGKDVVLVSLARAGTPIGILCKRYIKERYNLDLPHYSISIIRDRGIDENAIKYILSHHRDSEIQFIDGWTGKGTIYNVLVKACNDFYNKYNVKLNNSLAVLADPAGYSNCFGTREDFLIPSACLNSTVSGLISRTVLRKDLISKDDFHGAKYYKELKNKDESNKYINTISNEFKNIYKQVDNYMENFTEDKLTKLGDYDVKKVKDYFNIKDINYIKPGIGETTRVLLRRVPEKILVNNLKDEELNHIFELAKEKHVQVVEFPLKTYRCFGIIKTMKDV